MWGMVQPTRRSSSTSTGSAMSLPPSLASLDGVFNSVIALATNNVWAVGDYCVSSTCGTTHTLVAHWNGSTWSQVPSPNPSINSELFGIAAISPVNIWATGSEYAGESTPAGPLTENWNGFRWSVVPATSANSFTNTLRAVAAVPTGRMAWAVGDYQAGASGPSRKRSLSISRACCRSDTQTVSGASRRAKRLRRGRLAASPSRKQTYEKALDTHPDTSGRCSGSVCPNGLR
jgi:hypothetical protein